MPPPRACSALRLLQSIFTGCDSGLTRRWRRRVRRRRLFAFDGPCRAARMRRTGAASALHSSSAGPAPQRLSPQAATRHAFRALVRVHLGAGFGDRARWGPGVLPRLTNLPCLSQSPAFARVSSTASLLEDVSAPTMFERADGNWGDALELAQRGVRQVPAWRWLLT